MSVEEKNANFNRYAPKNSQKTHLGYLNKLTFELDVAQKSCFFNPQTAVWSANHLDTKHLTLIFYGLPKPEVQEGGATVAGEGTISAP